MFKDFSLDFKAGEVHCICGENGAGKSTLMKILSGVYQPDNGEILFEGQPVHIQEPKDAIELGIQTIYQEHTLYPQLTVTQNLFPGREEVRKMICDEKTMLRKTHEILEYLGAEISPNAIVKTLSDGQQKLVEIARGLMQKAKVIVMDEPTSSFNRKEINHLLDIIRKLRNDGVCIVYISHHLEETFQIADRVTVIRDGCKINTWNRDELTEQLLISNMVGRDVSAFYKREPVPVGELVLDVQHMFNQRCNDISFQLHRGEILGFSGMVGAGKTEVAETLFGITPYTSGNIILHGQEVKIQSAKDAIDHRLCFVTESRQHSGLFLGHSIMRNSVVVRYQKEKGVLVSARKDKTLAESFVKKLRIVTPNVDKQVRQLSGGNQQKVVLAKWFASDGDIFIFDEPTKGIDIGAREEIYHLMTALLKEGKSIILISSDMPELIAMSNRVCVMRDHRIVKELSGADINEQTILKYSIGGQADGT